MKEEKFKVVQYIRELILNIDNQLENFPKKDIELKNRIRNLSYELLENAYKANTISDNDIKRQNIELMIAKIKVLDFLINICYDKQIINSKKYIKFGNKMDDILKYSFGWLKSIK